MIGKREFCTLPDGRRASLYSLRNRSGFGVDVTDLNGAVIDLFVHDRNGRLTDVALGWKDPLVHADPPGCTGVIVGRVANRIASASFSVDGKGYHGTANEGKNMLHGGMTWFKRLWSVKVQGEDFITFSLFSPDGDAGFPGNLTAEVTYRIAENDSLILEYDAVADRPTLVNLTNHTYFNLNGGACADTSDLTAWCPAEFITAVDDALIPTGELFPVKGSAFDLSVPRSFGDLCRAIPGGYDHNLVLSREAKTWKEKVFTVSSPRTGIRLELSTTAPGVQFYMGGGLGAPENPEGKGGRYGAFSGFCLETQHWPDAPNHPEFPSIRIGAGEHYLHKTEFHFSVEA